MPTSIGTRKPQTDGKIQLPSSPPPAVAVEATQQADVKGDTTAEPPAGNEWSRLTVAIMAIFYVSLIHNLYMLDIYFIVLVYKTLILQKIFF